MQVRVVANRAETEEPLFVKDVTAAVRQGLRREGRQLEESGMLPGGGAQHAMSSCWLPLLVKRGQLEPQRGRQAILFPHCWQQMQQ